METTPKEITPDIEKLCEEISNKKPIFINVCVEDESELNECFANVEKKIKKNGGMRVLGWVIWQRDNILIQAEAHAVWSDREGNYIDVSPHEYDEKKILFLPDNTMVFNHKTIKSRRKQLTDSLLVKEFLSLLEQRDNIVDLYSIDEHKINMSAEVYNEYIRIAMRVNEINHIFNKKVGRNDQCSCGSGIKYKYCCGKYK